MIVIQHDNREVYTHTIMESLNNIYDACEEECHDFGEMKHREDISEHWRSLSIQPTYDMICDMVVMLSRIEDVRPSQRAKTTMNPLFIRLLGTVFKDTDNTAARIACHMLHPCIQRADDEKTTDTITFPEA